jgi:hypothetical protein
MMDIRMTAATDGPLTGFQLDFGPEMVLGANVPFDFTQMRVQAILNAVTDSLSVGIIIPPELAAMAGGGIGFRFDLAIPDPEALREMIPDSLVGEIEQATEEDGARFENTGTTAVVAGVACEEWLVTPIQEDEVGRVRMCLAEPPAAMRTLLDSYKQFLPDADNPFSALLTKGRQRFGGRDLLAMRVMIEGVNPMTFEVISISDTSPGVGFFELPIDLEPFPIEMVKAMAGAAGTATET